MSSSKRKLNRDTHDKEVSEHCPFWPDGEHREEVVDEYDTSVDISDYGSNIAFQVGCVCGYLRPSAEVWGNAIARKLFS